jgi:transposase-like protein
MAHETTINANPQQKALRNVGRINTLREWLADAERRKGTDRKRPVAKVKSMQAELDRRLDEAQQMRDILNDALDE